MQCVSAVLLLFLISVFGQIGIRQCLCTGQIAFATEVVEECEGGCCKKCGNPAEQNDLPSPCEDGNCWVTLTLNTVESPALPTPTPDPAATCPPTLASLDLLAPPVTANLRLPQHRLPDRRTVSLTVLFSSFLI